MKSHTTRRFRAAFSQLSPEVQARAREAYVLFVHVTAHPGLRFKRVHPSRPLYSVRIGLNYRALAVRDGEDLIWFWIGAHADYDNLLKGK